MWNGKGPQLFRSAPISYGLQPGPVSGSGHLLSGGLVAMKALMMFVVAIAISAFAVRANAQMSDYGSAATDAAKQQAQQAGQNAANSAMGSMGLAPAASPAAAASPASADAAAAAPAAAAPAAAAAAAPADASAPAGGAAPPSAPSN